MAPRIIRFFAPSPQSAFIWHPRTDYCRPTFRRPVTERSRLVATVLEVTPSSDLADDGFGCQTANQPTAVSVRLLQKRPARAVDKR
jgi:hypothetical protein